MITFTVVGVPGPQGSKRHVGGGRLIESSRKVKPWRAAVVAACPVERALLDVPVSVSITFMLPRPKRPRFPLVPAVPPDLDKCARSTLDALVEGGVLRDDARVVSLSLLKVWASGEPGAVVSVCVL